MTKTIKLSTLLSTGKLWEKGEHSRVYLGRIEVAKALGFDWESYKTGNPSTPPSTATRSRTTRCGAS